MKVKDINEPTVENNGLTIPREVADSITLESLNDVYHNISKNLNDHIVNGAYMHPQDTMHNHQLLYCLKVLIEYYGGEPPLA